MNEIIAAGMIIAAAVVGWFARRVLDSTPSAIGELRKELADLRLEVARNYISREDWVPMTSRVMGMLEGHGEQLARVEERIFACKDLHHDG